MIKEITEGLTGAEAAALIFENDSTVAANTWTAADAGATYPTVRVYNGSLYRVKQDATATTDNPEEDTTVWDYVGKGLDAIKRLRPFESNVTFDEGLFAVRDEAGNIGLLLDLQAFLHVYRMVGGYSTDGEFYIADSDNNVAFKIGKDGAVHLSDIISYSTDGEFYIADSDNNVAFKIGKDGKAYLDLSDETISKIFKVAPYAFDSPDYVFSTNAEGGLEVFTNIYPEGLSIDNKKLLINGQKKAIIQTAIRNSDSNALIAQNLRLGNSLSEDATITFDLVRPSRKNAQNKKIFLLGLGDSITAQDANYFDGTGGSWVNFTKQYFVKDNADIGDIAIITVGTTNNFTHNINYGGSTIAVNSKSEGRSGWATYGYLNYPKWVRLDGTAFESENNFIGAEAMYYLNGLATRTPYDSSTAGQPFAAYSDAFNEVIVRTPTGRFKPDITESLWTSLKNKWGYVSSVSTYAGNETVIRNEINLFLFGAGGIANCNGGVCFNPDNPFYDIAKAQAYTGAHSWTNPNAFSLPKYLERYRTLSNGGERLAIGDPALGTKVTDPDAYDVCMPTQVVSGLGTNDFGMSAELAAELAAELWNYLSSQGVKVGAFLPRRPGVNDPQLWQDYGYQITKDVNPYPHALNQRLKENAGSLGESNITYIPSFFTQSPISAAFFDSAAYDLDQYPRVPKVISGDDSAHLSAYALESIAYQVYSYINWTLQ